MGGLIFDIETNGFLDTVTKVHCLALREEEGGEVRSFGGHTDEKIRNVLSHLEDAPLLIGHNIMDFDIPVLKKVYPSFKPKGKIWDTLLDSQLIWTDLRDKDFDFQRKNPDFPSVLIGRHKLKAWGYRLGILKGTFGEEETWETWSEEMEEYCRQDVRVTAAFLDLIKSKNYSQQARDLEHEFKEYIIDQEREGFPFDEEKARAFYAELAAERAELEKVLLETFKPWTETKDFIPKRDNVKKGYVAGQAFKKQREVTFNPRSNQHKAKRLIAQFGWKPTDFTKTGLPTVDEDVLTSLATTIPVCKELARHAEIQKVIGMLAEGKTAWLKVVKYGRIYGRVITNGAVTGRCTHREPNLANIPRRSSLGARCRELFIAPSGYKLVGCDAKGLEIRILAHFLSPFDGGAYATLAVDGDPHVYHQTLAGLDTKDQSKKFFYSWLYGAGDEKIGLIIGQGQAGGKKLRIMFLKRFPALSKLKDAVSFKAKKFGYLKGLDGRILKVRAVYSSLNTLLQAGGAVLVKLATCLFNRELRRRGWFQEGIARQVVHCHDEFQVLVREGYEKEVGEIAQEAFIQAGKDLGLRCITEGDYKSGPNWKETH